MADEVAIPILPARDIDESIAFYESLGFTRTYRQLRPNPYAVVERDDLQIHLGGIDGFDPASSYASAIVLVPDPDALYAAFAAGLRAAYGKLPVAGIPRLLRPRRKQGTVYGFSVVDPGGNWLRVSRLGDREDAPRSTERGLPRAMELAARLADAHGDEGMAIPVLDRALARAGDAPAVERVSALLYRAELAVRVDDIAGARDALERARALQLTPDEQRRVADDLARTIEIVS